MSAASKHLVAIVGGAVSGSVAASSLIDKVVNPCMLNYLGSYIDIVEEPKQAKYYYSILKDCRAWHNVYIPNGREIYPYSLTSGAYIQSIWDQQKRKPLFQLTDEHRHKGNSILKKKQMEFKTTA